MAKAIFVREFHLRSKAWPGGWGAKPGPQVQSFPREFVDAAVAKGAAIRVTRASTRPITPDGHKQE